MLTWQMVDAIHPFGDKRADMRSGIQNDILLATHGGSPQGMDKYIIGRVGPEEPPQEITDDDVAAMFGLVFPTEGE